MASKRDIKREIVNKSNLLIEDAFIEMMKGDDKEAAKMDELIDEIIDERYSLLSDVCNYPKNEKNKKIKAYFADIRKNLNTKSADYTKKIGLVK